MSKVEKSAREAFERRILMKKYPGTLTTTKLDKSSAIFIRYPIINSIASDRLPIFLPINRHRQPKDKPLGGRTPTGLLGRRGFDPPITPFVFFL